MSAEADLPFASIAGKTEIALRSLRPIGATPNLLVTIPGGPGISSHYLDGFLARLDLGPAWNVAVIDLPGHGLSRSHEDSARIRYSDLVGLVSDAVRAVAAEHGRSVALGQSLGGRIVLDALDRIATSVAGAVLTGAPARFEPSTRFQRGLDELGLDFSTAKNETECAALWRKMIPLYFGRAPSEAELAVLCHDTSFLATSGMLEDARPLNPSMSSDRLPTLFIQGNEDAVVPDRNLEELRALFPKGTFLQLPGAGHFSMLEAPDEIREAIAEFAASVAKGTG